MLLLRVDNVYGNVRLEVGLDVCECVCVCVCVCVCLAGARGFGGGADQGLSGGEVRL